MTFNESLFEFFLWLQAFVLTLNVPRIILSLFLGGIVGGSRQTIRNYIGTTLIFAAAFYCALLSLQSMLERGDYLAAATIAVFSVGSSIAWKANNPNKK